MANRPDGAVSFPVSVKRLSPKGVQVKVVADEREREALRALHELQEVKSFTADLQVLPWKKDGVRVRGNVRAEIVQACIVTLEPIDTTVDTDVDAIFVPEGSRLARLPVDENGELIIDAEGPDVPESFSGDTIDAGAVAEEFFELAIDPYPRKPDLDTAPIAQTFGEAPEVDDKPSSFASLKDWKQKT